MNKFIKEQLLKCKVKLPDWNDRTTELVINSSHNAVTRDVHSGSFSIRIKNYIINEPSNFTLSSNWNGGTKPPEENMVVDILEKRGKMYKVKGVGVSSQITWEGWLPEKGFTIDE